jgi:hypothetical protein
MEFLVKFGWEGMTSYITRLIEITLKNVTIPRNWKIARVVHIYKGGFRSALSNYRPIRLTSVVCMQLEHVIAGYLRQVWDKIDWLYEEQRGFRPRYLREIKVILWCQNTADALHEYRCDHNRLLPGFRLSSS